MKIKTLGRIVGAVDVAVWSGATYLNYRVLSIPNLDYSKFREFFMGDHPLEHKIVAGLFIGMEAAFVPIIAIGITDGLVDIVKGTHHYFGMKVWKKLTRNPQRKEQIDREVEQMYEAIERPISYKARS